MQIQVMKSKLHHVVVTEANLHYMGSITIDENLMDAAAFARMKPDAFFVNMSRGNLVDEAALAKALTEGRIAG